MLTGRPPWSDRTKKASKVIALIKNPKESITVPKGLSEECYDFIFNSCLQRDPMKRWTAEELIHHPYLKKRLTSLELNQLNSYYPDTNEKQTSLLSKQQRLQLLKTYQPHNEKGKNNMRQQSLVDINKKNENSPKKPLIEMPRRNSMPSKQPNIDEALKEVGNLEEKHNEPYRGSVVALPNIYQNRHRRNEEENKSTINDENAYKTSNIRQWSDTQFDEGTCSMTFLKL